MSTRHERTVDADMGNVRTVPRGEDPDGHYSAPAATTAHVPPAAKGRGGWRLRSVCVALVGLVAINLVLQLDRRTWDVKSDTVVGLQKVQACESLGRKPDVLYLGSSRTLYGINPMVVDQAIATQKGTSILSCNGAVIGTNFEQDYYTLKRFIEDGYAPKLVVETLWERNLNVNAAGPMDNRPLNNAQVFNLADAQDVPDLLQHFGPGKRQQAAGAFNYLLGKAVPLYGDRVGILRSLCGDTTIGPCSVDTSQLDSSTQGYLATSIRLRGWAPLHNSLAQQSPATYEATNSQDYQLFHPEVQRFKIGGQQPGYLAKFISLAQSHGVKVALVATPLDASYYTFFDNGEADWQMIAAYWRSFANQHGVPLYDESHAPGFTSADFDDPHHLNATGAQAFSQWLALNVVAPTLRS